MTNSVCSMLENVTKSYFDGTRETKVLDHVSLVIPQGKFITLKGRSGSGKSTLLSILGGIDKPTSGKVIIDQTPICDINHPDIDSLRLRRIGFVFQSYNLITNMSVFENIAFPLILMKYPKAEIDRLVSEILMQIEMESFRNKSVELLSGGQRQRVAIARALVKKPMIVLADEPTANLDDKSADIVSQIFISLQKQFGITVFCSSHEKSFLNSSEVILELSNGQIKL